MYVETHWNIGSKRALPTGVLDTRQVTQLFTYLLTHNLFSSCIRRYLVWRACDWVMTALYLPCNLFSVSNSVCFSSISLARPHQHCGVLLDLIRNIGHRTLPKICVGTFQLIPTLKMETRHPVDKLVCTLSNGAINNDLDWLWLS